VIIIGRQNAESVKASKRILDRGNKIFLSAKINLSRVMNMATRTKAIYKEGILKPLEKLDLKEGEEVEIELKKSITERTFGIIQLEHNEIEEIIEDTEYGSW
jgi:predicted DNA-binding antitoxin AbrB/MazE fold protein